MKYHHYRNIKMHSPLRRLRKALNWIGHHVCPRIATPTNLGIVLTLLYVAVIFYWLGDRVLSLNEMKVNEIGDFLAGLFSPIAFGWLVYGYLMQNKEISINRKSISIQEKIQKESLEISNKNFKLQKDIIKTDIKNKIEHSSIKLDSLEIITGEKSHLIIKAKNIGSLAKKVRISNSTRKPFPTLSDELAEWKTGETQEINSKSIINLDIKNKILHKWKEKRESGLQIPFTMENDTIHLEYNDNRSMPRSLPIIITYMCFSDSIDDIKIFGESKDTSEIMNTMIKENPWL